MEVSNRVMPIGNIQIKTRVRKNLGDLSGLKESIRKHGILNPIVINSKHELLAGHRRLESARELGWAEVPVRIIAEGSRIDALEMELDENLHRRNLSSDELAEGYESLKKLRNPGLFRRILQACANFFKKLFGKIRG